MELLRRSGEGRDINRHYYSSHGNRARSRAARVAFADGSDPIPQHAPGILRRVPLLTGPTMRSRWNGRNGNDHARLHIDLRQMTGSIVHSGTADTQIVFGSRR
jgi:hypothetical protein